MSRNIEEVLKKFIENRCSSEEAEKVLHRLLSEEDAEQRAIIRRMLEMADDSSAEKSQYEPQLQRVFENISTKIKHAEKLKERRTQKIGLRPISIAATITIVIILGLYFAVQLQQREKRPNDSLHAVSNSGDLPPGTTKAILILANGSKIMLDDTTKGSVATQGSAVITKKDGGLIYNHKKTISSSIAYNVIKTPRGGHFQLTLSDGSKVWLNAASSIRFPTVFQEDERKIEISGEAYFEIATDKVRPFKVQFESSSGVKSEVTVLGTHFNIKCYKDETVSKTTLVEGSVKIASSGSTVVLKPAQQADIKDGQNINVRSNVNVQQAIAWKNGYFEFNATSLQEVMQQIGRWYDVEVRYEGKIPERNFGGKISRETNALDVLKILEFSGVRFRIEDKKIIVTP